MNSKDVALAIATDLLSQDAEKRMTSKALWLKALDERPDLTGRTVEATFKQKLSQLAKDSASGVVKPVGGHGYYFDADSKDVEELLPSDSASEIDRSEGSERLSQESLLYPVFVNYLLAKGYQAEDTSAMKSLKKWGNPDVVGIRVEEGLNGLDSYELVSVEAKIDSSKFKFDIFEAVSHRRFVNRAYFAFAAPLSWLGKQHDELRYYSELFSVGVLVAAMQEEDFAGYRDGQLTELDESNIDVFEVYSAPFEPKQPHWQRKLLEALDLRRPVDIGAWGRG